MGVTNSNKELNEKQIKCGGSFKKIILDGGSRYFDESD